MAKDTAFPVPCAALIRQVRSGKMLRVSKGGKKKSELRCFIHEFVRS